MKKGNRSNFGCGVGCSFDEQFRFCPGKEGCERM